MVQNITKVAKKNAKIDGSEGKGFKKSQKGVVRDYVGRTGMEWVFRLLLLYYSTIA